MLYHSTNCLTNGGSEKKKKQVRLYFQFVQTFITITLLKI